MTNRTNSIVMFFLNYYNRIKIVMHQLKNVIIINLKTNQLDKTKTNFFFFFLFQTFLLAEAADAVSGLVLRLRRRRTHLPRRSWKVQLCWVIITFEQTRQTRSSRRPPSPDFRRTDTSSRRTTGIRLSIRDRVIITNRFENKYLLRFSCCCDMYTGIFWLELFFRTIRVHQPCYNEPDLIHLVSFI